MESNIWSFLIMCVEGIEWICLKCGCKEAIPMYKCNLCKDVSSGDIGCHNCRWVSDYEKILICSKCGTQYENENGET